MFPEVWNGPAELTTTTASQANVFLSRGDEDQMLFFFCPRMGKAEDGCARAWVRGAWAWLGAAWVGPGSLLSALDPERQNMRSPHEEHLAGLERDAQGKREAQPC